MDTEIDRLARNQFGAIGRTQLLDLGFSERQIERRLSTGRIITLARSVYATRTSVPSWERQVLGAWLVTNERRHAGVLALSTAAALYGLTGYPRAGRPMLLALNGDRHPNALGTVMRRVDLEHEDVAMHCSGAHITTPIRTVLDLAMADGRVGRAAQIIDAATFQGLVTIDELWERFDRISNRGKPGSAHVRRVLVARDAGAVPLARAS